MLKIIFFGTSEFSAKILATLAKQFDVTAVITQPNKPVGRKQILTASAVSVEAEKLGLNLLKPVSLKNPEFLQQLKVLNADIILVVAYGKIIPRSILDLPKIGALNIHGSLLPKYRGASPIQAAILNGEEKTGISIMLMDEEVDHGAVLLEKSLEIGSAETFLQLEARMADLAGEVINKTIEDYATGKIKPEQQDHSKATFTKIISKEDGLINWNESAKQIYDKFRAYQTWPGIHTKLDGKNFKILSCKVYSGQPNHAHGPEHIGVVYLEDGNIFVPCSSGHLQLLEVQLEGKNPVAIQDFIRGYKNFIGAKLG